LRKNTVELDISQITVWRMPIARWIPKTTSTQITVWRMPIARWIPKTTSTHSEYVTLVAFPLQH